MEPCLLPDARLQHWQQHSPQIIVKASLDQLSGTCFKLAGIFHATVFHDLFHVAWIFWFLWPRPWQVTWRRIIPRGVWCIHIDNSRTMTASTGHRIVPWLSPEPDRYDSLPDGTFDFFFRTKCFSNLRLTWGIGGHPPWRGNTTCTTTS